MNSEKTEKTEKNVKSDSRDKTNVPTHINGSPVVSATDPHPFSGKREILCEDGCQYIWNPQTGAIYPLGHAMANIQTTT